MNKKMWVFFGILANFFRVYWYTTNPPWPTLKDTPIKMFQKNGKKSYVLLNKPDLLTRLWTDLHNWYGIFFTAKMQTSLLKKAPTARGRQ